MRFERRVTPFHSVPLFGSPAEFISSDTMAAQIYYDNDADLSHLKNKTIAILGYGSQDMLKLKTCATADAT